MTNTAEKTFLINGKEIKLIIPRGEDFLVGKIRENGDIIVSESMQHVVSKIRSYACGDDPIILEGQTGTGKGFVAKILHINDPSRSADPFVEIDCQMIGQNELDSVFFGDSQRNETGYFESVKQGTVFIKNITFIPLAFQIKLFQAFRTKKGKKLGSSKTDDYGKFRVIIGVPVSLEKMKQVLDDNLYYYLDGLIIRLPSLRSRQSEIVDLAHHFLNQINIKRTEYGKNKLEFDSDFEKSLTQFSFYIKGNLKELENMVKDCVNNCNDKETKITNRHVLEKYPTFGMNMDNKLVKYFYDYLIKIDYQDKSAEYISMSIASIFYTSEQFSDIILSDKNLHITSDNIITRIKELKLAQLNQIKRIYDELDKKKRDLIIDGLKLESELNRNIAKIAQALGYTSGAALTSIVQDIFYESYRKLKGITQIEILENKDLDQSIVKILADEFKQKEGYIENNIVKGSVEAKEKLRKKKFTKRA